MKKKERLKLHGGSHSECKSVKPHFNPYIFGALQIRKDRFDRDLFIFSAIILVPGIGLSKQNF